MEEVVLYLNGSGALCPVITYEYFVSHSSSTQVDNIPPPCREVVTQNVGDYMTGGKKGIPFEGTMWERFKGRKKPSRLRRQNSNHDYTGVE